MAERAIDTKVSVQARDDAGLRDRVVSFTERHPLWTLFLVALVLRVFAAVTAYALFGTDLVPDARTYHDIAAQKASGDLSTWTSRQYQIFSDAPTLLWPLTALYKVFGPHYLLGQLFITLYGAVAVVLGARLAMELMSRRAALWVGVILAILPSQIFWSSSILKDAGVWASLTGLALAVAIAGRSTGRRLLLAGAGVLVALVLVANLRDHTFVIACGAVAIACLFGNKEGRVPRIAGGLLIAIALPWAFGLGPAGTTLVLNSGSLEERRRLNAAGAETAFVDPEAPPEGGEGSDGGEGVGGSENNPAEGGGGPRHTDDGGGGPTPPDLDEAFLDPNLAHIPKGLEVMLFEPNPLRTGSRELNVARFESLLWYPILFLSAIGIWAARRRLRVIAFPLVAGLGVLLMYALVEGNIGTAYRHRGEFVWVVVLFVPCGITWLRGARSKRTEGESATA